MAKSIMIQGTASNVGKSILVAGLCRIFLEDGYSVAPFKAQNMALNSFVTEDGLEMGRAQVTQAQACRIKPDVHMNPVLLKPCSDCGSQVIVMGKPMGHMHVKSYYSLKETLRQVVHDAYNHLSGNYEVIVIEGAGSPAEINLKKNDLTNMFVAKMAKSPVIIVGDIDRGGVYAHLLGTFDLLDEMEQELTAGFIINKFRGDQSLLQPANVFLENRTERKLFGVVPMIKDLNLPDEDSVEFKKKVGQSAGIQTGKVNIALVDLPHISNFSDFDVLETDDDVHLVTIDSPNQLELFDMVILPGSKNTLRDMQHLQKKKFHVGLKRFVATGKMLVGICGGYQMLGEKISDPQAVESTASEVQGFGFMNMNTIMASEKQLTQVKANCFDHDIPLWGYEIHHGHSETCELPFLIHHHHHEKVLGHINKDGNVWGTYIHGVFDSGMFRNFVINRIRKQKGLPLTPSRADHDIDAQLSRLAAIIRKSIDMDAVYRVLMTG